jgi:hypothetical protein
MRIGATASSGVSRNEAISHVARHARPYQSTLVSLGWRLAHSSLWSVEMTIPQKTFNYVAFFSQTGRIKVGITGDIQKRMGYYRQEARRHDLGHVTFACGQKNYKGLARTVETELCRALKQCAVPQHREWFAGDYEAFQAVVALTRRMQAEMREAFGVESSNA